MTYIDPAGKVLFHIDRIAEAKRGHNPPPIGVEIDLSNRCNLGCRWCHFAYTHSRGPLVNNEGAHTRGPSGNMPGGDLMDTELAKRILEELADAGVLSVTWTGGGEPTLHPGFIDIISHAHHLELEQGMYTNGVLITSELAELIKQYFTWCYVSLDAASAADFAAIKQVRQFMYRNALEGIRRLVGGDATIGVGFLLTRDNWEAAPRMLRLANSLGPDYVQFRPAVIYDEERPARPAEDTSWVDEALPLLLELSEQSGVELRPRRFLEYAAGSPRAYGACYAMLFTTVITPDGKVWECVNRRQYPDSCLGDLNQKSFGQIWRDHPGPRRAMDDCRVLCRGHMMNQTLWEVFRERPHANFV